MIVGKLFSPHGIKGAVKFASYTEDPDTLFSFSPLYCDENEINIKKVSDKVISIKDVSDRNAAETYRHKELWVWREQLPEIDNDEEYYQEDLIGFDVLDAKNKRIGAVLGFHNFGAGDIIEIGTNSKDSEFVGFHLVDSVNVEAQTITLTAEH